MNMNIQYRKEGDYYIPDWTIPKNQQKPLGLYGRMRKAYLEEHRSGLYTRMLLLARCTITCMKQTVRHRRGWIRSFRNWQHPQVRQRN